ncbi:hypothetical protein SERLADRAFT_471616 [Serpula lacrymans var. lacrymans S7.9]|uniref:Uncharacterized protein n=1 Tax=Serpula lacrymans var. lacrymans (strain S7.9) TaxID=578457 RepID=F8P1H6_SERL9|nr:uncharacterized protein SERLADRAFT_471616 [Serpula lacrymans var. lacrymans S7.9]EGO23005.1 hypothetical protein SERLADRAFT_471616 [Serpula lacrymans var. lacrymans S7.9]
MSNVSIVSSQKVILVGGLASSPYVFSRLVEWGKENGVSVIRPDGPTVKAVANGALAWHIDDTVSCRVSKYHYGTEVHLPYDKEDKEAVDRTSYTDCKGQLRVCDGWSCIVKKDCSIGTNEEFVQSYMLEVSEGSEVFDHEVIIFAYRRAKPQKFITLPGSWKMYPGYEKVCTVSGDLRRCFLLSPRMVSVTNTVYREVTFDVCIVLGDTEISARLRWKEDGKLVYGPAKISYD